MSLQWESPAIFLQWSHIDLEQEKDKGLNEAVGRLLYVDEKLII